MTRDQTPSSSLGELEQTVLERLWSDGPLTTPEVHERVGKPRNLAYTTILTVLQRLAKKGLTIRSETGKGHTHVPALSRDEFAVRRGESLAAMVTELGAVGMTAFLAQAERLDPGVLATLREALTPSS